MYVEKMTGYGGKYMMGSLFLSSVVIRIIKWSRVQWVSHVACMLAIRCAYRIVIEIFEDMSAYETCENRIILVSFWWKTLFKGVSSLLVEQWIWNDFVIKKKFWTKQFYQFDAMYAISCMKVYTFNVNRAQTFISVLWFYRSVQTCWKMNLVCVVRHVRHLMLEVKSSM